MVEMTSNELVSVSAASTIIYRNSLDLKEIREEIKTSLILSFISLFSGGSQTEEGKKKHMLEQLGKMKVQHAIIYAGTQWAGITEAKVKELIPFAKLSENIQPVMWAVMSAMGYDIEAESEADETGNPKGQSKKSPKPKRTVSGGGTDSK